MNKRLSVSQVGFAISMLAASLVLSTSADGAPILPRVTTWDGPTHNVLDGFGSPFVGGGEDMLIDESRAKWADRDGSLSFTAGDIFFGWIAMSDANPSGALASDVGESFQMAVAWSGKLAGAGSGPSGAFVAGDVASVVPVAAALDTLDLRNLLHTDITGAAGLDDSSVFVIVGNEIGTSEGGTSPQNFDKATATAEMSEFNASNSFGDTWTWEATAGILGGDFWDIVLDEVPPPVLAARERGGFTVQSHAYGSVVWLPVDVLNMSAPLTVSTHDLALASANVFSPSQDAPWDFADNSTMVVNPTPEPASMLVWSAMAGLMVLGYRRKRRAKS